MASVSVVVDIAAPPERAWQAVADVADWPRWTTSMSVAWTGVFGGLTGALAGKRTRKSITRDANGHKACAENAA